MKTLSKTILAVLATGVISCALFSQQAQADPITGAITFGGSVNMNGNANTATMVTGWHGFGGVGNPLVIDCDGTFAAEGVVPGVSTGIFAVPWTFNSGAVTAFWTVGGFTFDLTMSSIFSQGSGGLVVTGFGVIKHAGYEDTYGTWSFSTQNPGVGSPARFSFSAATGAVPDSGSTVAFLGLALVGVEALRRRLRTAT
jgi:VPDSG-CTERM motif